MSDYFQHRTALVESKQIGRGTRIWAYVHVMEGSVIGEDCNICDYAFVESGVTIGRGVTVKTAVAICEGVHIGDGVFIGPNAAFTNDLRPRSPRIPMFHPQYQGKGWLKPTHVDIGATIGCNSTVICGVTVGQWAFVAAGSVVTRDVPPFSMVRGNPAKAFGYVCVCAESLKLEAHVTVCARCGREYVFKEGSLTPTEEIEMWGSLPR